MKGKLIAALILILLPGCITYYINGLYIKGQWTDFVRPKRPVGYFGMNSITIRFTSDSFFYYNNRWSDVISNEPCPYYSGEEYACGKYAINDGLLNLVGNWTDKSYKNIKTSGCYNDGIFEITYRCEILEKKKFQLSLLDSASKYRTGVKKNLILYKE